MLEKNVCLGVRNIYVVCVDCKYLSNYLAMIDMINLYERDFNV